MFKYHGVFNVIDRVLVQLSHHWLRYFLRFELAIQGQPLRFRKHLLARKLNGILLINMIPLVVWISIFNTLKHCLVLVLLLNCRAWIESLRLQLLTHLNLPNITLLILYFNGRNGCNITWLLCKPFTTFKNTLMHLSLIYLIHQLANFSLYVPHFLHSLVWCFTLLWYVRLNWFEFVVVVANWRTE